jgi:hypothetical protein
MRSRRIDPATLAAELGVDCEHLMWRAANENESQLSSIRQTTSCLQHFDLLVPLSARALFEKFSLCSPFALSTAPSSSNFAGFNKWATTRRIHPSGGVTSSGASLGPPSDTGRSVAARLYLVASVSLDAAIMRRCVRSRNGAPSTPCLRHSRQRILTCVHSGTN